MSHAHPAPTRPITVTIPGPSRLEVRVRATEASRATVELHGEMDLATADLLIAVVDSQHAAGRRFVRLDLSRLEFLDAAGLRGLLNAHNRLLTAHGMLTLTGVGPRIARLLHITHLDQTLYIADPDQTRCVAESPGQPPRHLSALPHDHTG
jgi:anti-sigma B factor antagonist